MSADPVELVPGLTTADNVSKSAFVAYEKTNIRDFADADEVRNSQLDGRWVIFVRETLSLYRKNTSSTEDDDGVNYIIDESGNVWEVIGGDVVAALAFGTDNRVLRSDGTDKGVQSSGVTLDDSNNISGINNLTAGGLVDLSGASAGQIKFPGTQHGSSNVNTLDDYEEGTFTPGVTFGGAFVGGTYGTQIGRYTKIGNRVFYSFYFVLSSKGSSTGSALLTGLPFTSAAAVTSGAGYINNSSAASNVVATVGSGVATITPNYFSGGNVAALSNTDFGNSTVIALGGNYEAA
jgi:hypothetical protein